MKSLICSAGIPAYDLLQTRIGKKGEFDNFWDETLLGIAKFDITLVKLTLAPESMLEPFTLDEAVGTPLGEMFTIEPGLMTVTLDGNSCIPLETIDDGRIISGNEGVRDTRSVLDGA